LPGALKVVELVCQVIALGLETFIHSRRTWSRSRSLGDYGRGCRCGYPLYGLLDQRVLGRKPVSLENRDVG
jgi:hypothetical protein